MVREGQGESEKKSNFPDRLKIARVDLRLTQAELAERWGKSTNYIWMLESGTKQFPKKLEPKVMELEKELERGELVHEESAPFRVQSLSEFRKLFRAPVVSWASAGIGGDFSDLAEHLDEFVETDCADPNCYALIVEGRSMEPELKAGDRIVVAPNLEARTGDIVVARLAETGQVFLKVLEFLKSNRVRLTSYNKDFREIELSREELRFIQPVWGLANRRLKR